MMIFMCPKVNQWSHKDCDCPGEKDDEQHAAVDIEHPAVVIATLLKLIGDTYDDIRDGEDSEATMECIADVYLELTGNLI